jgi:predicted GTPase
VESGCESELLPRLQALLPAARERAVVGFIGTPNSGKSTLLNALLERPLLPVAPLPFGAEAAIASPQPDGDEAVIAGGVRHPLDSLAAVVRDGNGQRIEIAVRNRWLADERLELVERPFDAPPEELDEAADAALTGLDAVVLVIDAWTPMKRSEARLLERCASRQLPVIVIVTRCGELSQRNRDDSLGHVVRHARTILRDVAVLDDATASPESIRAALSPLIAPDTVAVTRQRQLRWSLRALLADVRSVAAAQAAHQAAMREDQEHSAAERQRRLAAAGNQWLQIEVRLLERRRLLDDRIRADLQAGETSVVNNLFLDLQRTNDVKTWWRHELAYRLEQELTRLCAGVTGAAETQLAADLQWLIEEVKRCFATSMSIETPRIRIAGSGDMPAEPELSDANAVKIISMAGSALALLIAGGIFATGGGVVLAIAGVLTGGAGELYARFATSLDRAKARGAVESVVRDVRNGCTAALAKQLTTTYDAILVALREARFGWELRQSSGDAAGASGFDAAAMLAKIDQLSAGIAAE